MPKLRLIQKKFQDYLFGKNEIIHQSVLSPSKNYSIARMGIYGDAYFLRLLDILGLDFPILKKILGDYKFRQVAQKYLASYPSHYFTVKDVGMRMPKFLKGYLSEMAMFERALCDVSCAADGPILSVSDMASIPPESWPMLRITLHPSVKQYTFQWNVPEVWQSRQKAKNSKRLPKKTKKPVTWSIWRRNLDSCFCQHSPEEISILNAIQKGKNFASICGQLAKYMPEDRIASYVVTRLHTWIQNSMLSTVSIEK